MNKRGYIPAICGSEDLKSLVDNLNAYDDLKDELLGCIDRVARGCRVTRTELKRDYGFTSSSLRLLEKNKQLIPITNSSQRETFDLAKALKIRVLQSGILAAKHIRTTRKHNNIVTIYRDYFNKITEAEN